MVGRRVGNMDIKSRSSVANILGIVTTLYLAFLWMVVLNPLRWNVSFPGGIKAGFITMLLAICASTLAALWGKRAWWIIAACSIGTFIYIGFFYRMPLWY